MRWSITAKTLVAGVITLALLAFIGLASIHQAHQSRELAHWMSHSEGVLNTLGACRDLADASEDEARSYSVTGDAQLLSEYRSHSTELAAKCAEILVQVSDNPSQTARARQLSAVCQTEVKTCDGLTEHFKKDKAVDSGDLAEAYQQVRAVEDKVAEIEAEEKELLALRSAHFLEASNNILIGQVTLLALSIGVLATAFLMTRRWLHEEQRSAVLLKSSQLQFTGVFNQAFQQVWLLSIAGNILKTNQTALGFVGLTRETEIGRAFWESIWWKNQPQTQELLKAALPAAAQGKLERFEVETTNASGQRVFLDFSLKPLLGEDQKVELIIAEGRDITQVKSAQGELKENQIRLAAILQSLAEGLCQLDVDGRIVFLNAAGAKMLGYAVDDLLGKAMHEVIHASDTASDQCPLLTVIQKGGVANQEDQFRRRDGSLVPVQLLSAPLTVDGLTKGSVISFYDITARKEAQARVNIQFALTSMLSQADSLEIAVPKLLQKVCEFIGWELSAFWLVDQQKDTLRLVDSWNDPEFSMETNSTLMNNKTLALAEDFARKVRSQNAPIWMGKGSHVDSPFLAEARHLGLQNIFAFPVRSDEVVLGVIALLSKSAQEPTSSQLQMLNAIGSQFGLFIERQKSQDDLRDREMLFQQLVNNIRDVFWVSSAKPGENKVLYVSPAFEEIWGRPVSEVYERANSYVESIVPEDRERVKQHVRKEMYSGSSIEYRIIRPDGTTRWVWGRWSPVFGADGKPERIVGIVHDISERKEIERRVSEFYSTVSHELRTPLTSIRASLGLLEGGLAGELSAKATKLVSIARSECDRLIRLINDILDIRKIEAGRLELKLNSVKARKIVELTVQGTAGMALDYGVKVVPQIESELEPLADQDRLIQVLTNLVSNAIKFAPANSEIIINVKEHDGSCRFSVSDSGPGISPEQRPKLFGLFQQLDSTDSRPKGGTGLGLAISKAIVEQHSGLIDVESEPGKGSKFYFDIPLVRTSSAQLKELATAENLGNSNDFILLVEDDKNLCQVLSELLQAESYNVRIAHTIAEADEILGQDLPQAVILDVHLPDGNGLDWMRRIGQSESTACIPVVVLTGQESCDSYGTPLLIDWLRKPVDLDQLLRALKVGIAHVSVANNARVLIVEDDASTREILVQQLNEVGLVAMEASSGFMALKMVQEHKPDLIILDLGLPGFDGFELVKKFQSSGLGSTPLLVYTSRDLSNADMEKLKLGLSRHLIKSKTSQAEFLSAVRELLSNVLLQR